MGTYDEGSTNENGEPQMLTSPAELQAIRERDAALGRGTPTDKGLADRRTLLALYDAHEADKLRLSDEVRRLRSDIQTAVDLLLIFNNDAHARNPMAVTAIDHFLATRGLGSQP